MFDVQKLKAITKKASLSHWREIDVLNWITEEYKITSHKIFINFLQINIVTSKVLKTKQNKKTMTYMLSWLNWAIKSMYF